MCVCVCVIQVIVVGDFNVASERRDLHATFTQFETIYTPQEREVRTQPLLAPRDTHTHTHTHTHTAHMHTNTYKVRMSVP